MNFAKRIPPIGQIAPVYAVIVMMLYGWTIVWLFWQIPSWLKYLPLFDVLGIFFYAMVVNFLESLSVLLLLLALSILLPEKWFRQSFVSRSVSFLLLAFGGLMYYSNSFTTVLEKDFPQQFVNWLPLIAVGAVLIFVLVDRVNILRNLIVDFASRAVIFLYISIPMSIIALLYVVARNLLWRLINA